MGKQSRRKREDAAPDHRRSSQTALIAACVKEIRDRGKPCLLCGQFTRSAGIWVPAERFARYLGAPPGRRRAIVYALCAGCAADPSDPRVEAKILQERRLRLAAEEAEADLTDGFIRLGDPEDVRRFAEAYRRHEPPR
jgi:hypothetical protein